MDDWGLWNLLYTVWANAEDMTEQDVYEVYTYYMEQIDGK